MSVARRIRAGLPQKPPRRASRSICAPARSAPQFTLRRKALFHVSLTTLHHARSSPLRPQVLRPHLFTAVPTRTPLYELQHATQRWLNTCVRIPGKKPLCAMHLPPRPSAKSSETPTHIVSLRWYKVLSCGGSPAKMLHRAAPQCSGAANPSTGQRILSEVRISAKPSRSNIVPARIMLRIETSPDP